MPQFSNQSSGGGTRKVAPHIPNNTGKFHRKVKIRPHQQRHDKDDDDETGREINQNHSGEHRDPVPHRMPSIRKTSFKGNNTFRRNSNPNDRQKLHRAATSPPRMLVPRSRDGEGLVLPPFQGVSNWTDDCAEGEGYEIGDQSESSVGMYGHASDRMVQILKQKVHEQTEQLRARNKERAELEDQLENACDVHRKSLKLQREKESVENDLYSVRQKLEQVQSLLSQEQEMNIQRTEQLASMRKKLNDSNQEGNSDEITRLRREVKVQESLRESIQESVEALKQANHEQQLKNTSLQSELMKRKKDLARVSRESHEAIQNALLSGKKSEEQVTELNAELSHVKQVSEGHLTKLKSLQKQFHHKNAVIAKRDGELVELKHQVEAGEQVKKQLEATQKALVRSESQVESLEEKVYSLKTVMEEQMSQHHVNDNAIGDLKQEVNKLRAKLESARNESEAVTAQLGISEGELSSMRDELMRTKGEAVKATAELSIVRAQLQHKAKSEHELKMKVIQMEREMERQVKEAKQFSKDTTANLNAERSKNKNLQSELAVLQSRLAKLKTESDNFKQSLNAKEARDISTRAENAKLHEQVKRLNDCIQAQESEIQSLKDELKSTSEALLEEQGLSYASNSTTSKAKSRVEQLEHSLAEKEKECTHLSNELDKVKKLREDDQAKVTEKINAAKTQVLRLKRLEQELMRIKQLSQVTPSSSKAASEHTGDTINVTSQECNAQEKANIATELVRLQARAVALERQNEAMRDALKTNPRALESLQTKRKEKTKPVARNRKGFQSRT